MRIDLWAFKVPKIVSTLLALSVISITFRFYFGFVWIYIFFLSLSISIFSFLPSLYLHSFIHSYIVVWVWLSLSLFTLRHAQHQKKKMCGKKRKKIHNNKKTLQTRLQSASVFALCGLWFLLCFGPYCFCEIGRIRACLLTKQRIYLFCLFIFIWVFVVCARVEGNVGMLPIAKGADVPNQWISICWMIFSPLRCIHLFKPAKISFGWPTRTIGNSKYRWGKEIEREWVRVMGRIRTIEPIPTMCTCYFLCHFIFK